jgi:hypothetical protein
MVSPRGRDCREMQPAQTHSKTFLNSSAQRRFDSLSVSSSRFANATGCSAALASPASFFAVPRTRLAYQPIVARHRLALVGNVSRKSGEERARRGL